MHNHEEKPNLISLLIRGIISLIIILFLHAETSIGTMCYSLAAIILIGYPVLSEAIEELFQGHPFNECMLMAIAATGACCIGEYHEAYFVLLLYAVGEYLQDMAVDRSRHSIEQLIELVPKEVEVLCDGKTVTKALEDIVPGDKVLVKPGTRIPVDGVITEGAAGFNTAALTGESFPRDLGVGDTVCGGYIAIDHPVTVEATLPYDKSSIAKLQELIDGASARKAKAEKFITRFSRIYTPVIIAAAALIIPFTVNQGWHHAIYTAVTFLVTACPCALVLSIPLAFFAGIGAASKHNVLIKGAEHLETLSHVTQCAFDKTGTVTTGDPTVANILAYTTHEELVSIAVNAERQSNHPMAKAIVNTFHCPPREVSASVEHPGLGVECLIDGIPCAVGNRKLMQQLDIEITGPEYMSAAYVTKNYKLIGVIAFNDTVKENAPAVMEQLKGLGIKVLAMISGDIKLTANDVARRAGMSSVYAEQSPEQKVDTLETLMQTGTTLYAGDGLNDAAVLARADVGVAMGGAGSDIAIDSADIIITDDNLEGIPAAISIARKTMRVVRQNIIFALLSKLAVLALTLLGIPNMMWLAVLADTGVALICAMNALRILLR